MNKAEREQLKHNETADALMAIGSLLAEHGRTLALTAVAVLLLVGSVFGYRAFKARTEERAQVQLAEAIATLDAPVAAAAAAGATPAPAAAARYSMRQASSKARRGLRGKIFAGSALPRLMRKFDFQRPSGKNAASTLALSKPDIGPQSSPSARAAMMK